MFLFVEYVAGLYGWPFTYTNTRGAKIVGSNVGPYDKNDTKIYVIRY